MILEGILAGFGHVATGPDHLVGIAPLAVARERRMRPAVVGATWGLGHGVGVAILGVLGQTILSATQVDIASSWAERLVGFVLIVLGLVTLRRARSLVLHEHEHMHDGDRHVHLHVHRSPHGHSMGSTERGSGHGHSHAAFGIGVVHGLAGAGHFWAVLPSLAMPPATAATYIASYVLASLVIMSVFGAVLGRVARRVGVAWLPLFFRGFGALTIAVGVWWTIAAFGLA